MKKDLLFLKILASLLLIILVFAGITLTSSLTNAMARDEVGAIFEQLGSSANAPQQFDEVFSSAEPELHPVPTRILHPVVQTDIKPSALNSHREKSAKPVSLEPTKNEVAQPDNPNPYGTLIVPKIEINHQTVRLPFIDGQWQTDHLGSDIGLLDGTGRFPHDDQAMVFAGHYTTYWPVPGPFIDLDQLVPNDEIFYIYNDQKHIYQISQLAYVNPDQVDLIFRDDSDQIVLLTCGQFNLFSGGFDKRLLVIADLVEVRPHNSN